VLSRVMSRFFALWEGGWGQEDRSERGNKKCYQRQHAQVLNEKKGIQVYSLFISYELSVGFLRRGATRDIFKSEGTQPAVKDWLMRDIRNGR
jgi:hypothetical protein